MRLFLIALISFRSPPRLQAIAGKLNGGFQSFVTKRLQQNVCSTFHNSFFYRFFMSSWTHWVALIIRVWLAIVSVECYLIDSLSNSVDVGRSSRSSRLFEIKLPHREARHLSSNGLINCGKHLSNYWRIWFRNKAIHVVLPSWSTYKLGGCPQVVALIARDIVLHS